MLAAWIIGCLNRAMFVLARPLVRGRREYPNQPLSRTGPTGSAARSGEMVAKIPQASPIARSLSATAHSLLEAATAENQQAIGRGEHGTRGVVHRDPAKLVEEGGRRTAPDMPNRKYSRGRD